MSITHAAMMGGDAAMLVALADSLFLSIDPSAARGRVLLFLVVSFAPFLLVAPLVGPAIDRAAGGRRMVIMAISGTRVVLALAIAASLQSLRLFPLVFVALVLQKAYVVSKQALVPSVVRSESELVEANSKLGVIAGLTGFVAVIPAGLIQLTPARGWGTLIYSAGLFAFGFASATRLPNDVVAATPAKPAERAQLHSAGLQLAAVAMMTLRASVGFVFFLLAFWLRTQSAGTLWFGIAIAMSAAATIVGNALSPRIRRFVREELMLAGALGLSAAAGLVAAFMAGPAAGVLLAVAVNFSAAVGRLAFESIVQRDAPQANRGRAFARFETRFQFAWAVAGLIPIVIVMPGWVGFLIVGLVCAASLVNFVAATRTSKLRLRRRSRHPSRRPTGPTRPAGRPLPPPTPGDRPGP